MNAAAQQNPGPTRTARAARIGLLLAGGLLSRCSGPAPERHTGPAPGLSDWPLSDARLGPWGENAGAVPAFALVQERRAPKMPDADRYFAKLPDSPAGPFAAADALLICLTEIYSADGREPRLYRYKLGPPDPQRPVRPEDWDTFNAPDARLSFRFRGEHPITLYGPEDHWGFYISIPRVRLRAGDLIELRLWDRDNTSDEFIGQASARFDGAQPIVLRAPYFTAQCRVMPAAQVQREAAPLLAQADQEIGRAAEWQPDVRRFDFGMPAALGVLQSNWGRPNLRYLAGFLGWDQPLVQERFARIRALEDEMRQRRGQYVARLKQEAPGPEATGTTVSLAAPVGEVRVAPACAPGGECRVELTVPAATPGTLLCSADRSLGLYGVTAQGAFIDPARVLVPDGKGWRDCRPADPPQRRMRADFLPAAGVQLLWLGVGGVDGHAVRAY